MQHAIGSTLYANCTRRFMWAAMNLKGRKEENRVTYHSFTMPYHYNSELQNLIHY